MPQIACAAAVLLLLRATTALGHARFGRHSRRPSFASSPTGTSWQLPSSNLESSMTFLRSSAGFSPSQDCPDSWLLGPTGAMHTSKATWLGS